MITVREATDADLPFLSRVEGECFSDPWSQGSISSQLSSPCGDALVAEQDGTPVGCFAGTVIPPEGEVLRVGVLPAARGQGAGTALIAAFFRRHPEISVCFLEVRRSNAAALALYRKLGFAECGVRRNYYTAPKEDALILKWERS